MTAPGDEVPAIRGRGLGMLLDALPLPVYFKDARLRYLRVNRAACELMGRQREDIVGRADSGLYPPELAGRLEREDRRVLDTGEPLTVDDQVVPDAQGNIHYFQAYKAPIRDGHGEVIGLVSLATDVTERRLAEAERLTTLRRQRDALVQEVHHRIKNHLQGVAGLLHRCITAHPAVAGPLRGVLSQIESIAGIHGLQSRLGNQRLRPGEVVEMVARLAPEPVAVAVSGAMPLLSEEEAVPFALTINELISNACKHRAEAGRPVRVTLAREAGGLNVRVESRPARLPPEFDFAAGQGLGTGLRLVRTLLSTEGARLRFCQADDAVVAELELTVPFLAGSREEAGA